MKPDSTDTPATGPAAPQMWVGLEQLEASPEFQAALQNEFPDGASEFTDEPSRRRFLALMGASLALSTGAGCNLRPAPSRQLYPYTEQPDQIVPGVPTLYATACPLGGYGQGVLVVSNEGRPTKIEGNVGHPSSKGGAGVHALASALDLYDPDRARGVTRRGLPSSFEDAVGALRAKLYGAAKPSVRVLTETVTSPTLGRLVNGLLGAFDGAKWVVYDAVGEASAREAAKVLAGGAKDQALRVVYDFHKADVVLSLDSDVLTVGPGAVRYQRDFGDRRKVRQGGKTLAEVHAADKKDGKPPAAAPEGVKLEALNRLYAVESMPTNTGAVADHRLPLKASLVEAFAYELAKELKVANLPAAGPSLPADAKLAKDWIKPLAADLLADAKNGNAPRTGKTLVVAGDHCSPALHALVLGINATLGNIGTTVLPVPSPEVTAPGKASDLRELTAELNAGKVDVLLVIGDVNPAFTAPTDIDFAAALKKATDDKKLTLQLSQRQDETAVLCEWHLNEAHYLEAWGDVCGHDGTVAIQQPLIAPLHGGKSAIELFAALLRGTEAEKKGEYPLGAMSPDPMEVVKATTKARFGAGKSAGDFERFWQRSVKAGVVEGSTPAPVQAAVDLAKAPKFADAPKGDYEINIRACPSLYDGRFANNGWLQELPKPLTKISWDNAAFVSPLTAEKLKVETSFRWTGGEHGRAEVNVVEIEVGGKKVKAPVWILPGHADDAITVHLGHGRDAARVGRIAMLYPDAAGAKNVDGQAVHGFNAYPLRTSQNLWTTAGKASVVPGQTYYLACTQGHWAMAEKDPISGKLLDRKPVRRGSVEDYEKNPTFAKLPPAAVGEAKAINDLLPGPKKRDGKKDDETHKDDHGHDGRLHPLIMYNPEPTKALAPGLPEKQWRRWGMAIDLNACTGCSACVVACQGENNIPVVGKDQVTKGRIMHWINIDRYYESATPDMKGAKDAASIKAYFQPRMCVQCENAPCEIVCPVGATVHGSDGLNDMAYNRCVGTRYCSNNCPYKVRRFNFLTFQDWNTDTLKLGRNPDVSVRSRGVMEKCTFCTQRIRGAEIKAEREFRPIRDGDIVTACQSACPSGAIVFGDLNDVDSAVNRWKSEPANYGLLAEINTRPRLTHLAVIRNINDKMPKA